MPASSIAGMSGMQPTVIAYIENDRLQCGKAPANFLLDADRCQAGRVLRKGFTETLA